MEKQITPIAREIAISMGKLILVRPYIALTDTGGNILYIDRALKEHLPIIKRFIGDNAQTMVVGGYSVPFSGMSIAFFKVSAKATVIIYAKKGVVGQLLAFLPLMEKFAAQLDDLISEVTISDAFSEAEPEVFVETDTTIESEVKIYPRLIKKINGEERFAISDAVILYHCDGKTSIADICATGVAPEEVWACVGKYKRKGWVAVTYTGKPTLIPILVDEIPKMAALLGVINRTEEKIVRACNGKNTLNDIQNQLGDIERKTFRRLISKMEKSGLIYLRIQ